MHPLAPTTLALLVATTASPTPEPAAPAMLGTTPIVFADPGAAARLSGILPAVGLIASPLTFGITGVLGGYGMGAGQRYAGEPDRANLVAMGGMAAVGVGMLAGWGLAHSSFGTVRSTSTPGTFGQAIGQAVADGVVETLLQYLLVGLGGAVGGAAYGIWAAPDAYHTAEQANADFAARLAKIKVGQSLSWVMAVLGPPEVTRETLVGQPKDDATLHWTVPSGAVVEIRFVQDKVEALTFQPAR